MDDFVRESESPREQPRWRPAYQEQYTHDHADGSQRPQNANDSGRQWRPAQGAPSPASNAEAVAKFVHDQFLYEAQKQEPYHSAYDPNGYGRQRVDALLGRSQNILPIEQMKDEPAFKSVMPEIATDHLARNFDKIHDKRDGDVLTIDELKRYADNCDGKPVAKLTAEYAIKNYDKYKEQDPMHRGITQDALKSTLSQFESLELQRAEKADALKMEPLLKQIQDNFDQIQPNKERSIMSIDLKKFQGKSCDDGTKSELVREINTNFKTLANLDDADGSATWTKLWMGNGNAVGITRSDIAKGLANAQEARNTYSFVDDRFNYWAK